MIDTRLATNADVPELVRVVNAAYRVEDFFINGDRTNEADIRERLAGANSSFLVIDRSEGALAAAVYLETKTDRGYFAMLSVDPACQGGGLGRALVEAIEERCRAAGCRFLDIEVVDLRTELPPFYRRFGFEVSGTAPFPDPHKLKRPAHLVLMSKKL